MCTSHVCMYVRICVYMYVCMCVCSMYACTYVCVYVCTYVCMKCVQPFHQSIYHSSWCMLAARPRLCSFIVSYVPLHSSSPLLLVGTIIIVHDTRTDTGRYTNQYATPTTPRFCSSRLRYSTSKVLLRYLFGRGKGAAFRRVAPPRRGNSTCVRRSL